MIATNTRKGLENFIPFNVPANAETVKEVARKELGETEELKEECLQQLRTLIKDHNIACITTDDFLLRFLRTRKFNVKRSFDAVQNYASQRVALHKRIMKWEPENVRKILEVNLYSCLPYRDAEGRQICLINAELYGQATISDEDVLMGAILLADYAAQTQSAQTVGMVTLFELKILRFSHISFLLRNGITLSNFFFNSLPARYHKVHLINQPLLTKYFLRLLSPFLPRKIVKRIMFHGESRDVLFQHIPATILPNDFGGNIGPLNNDHMTEDVVDYLKKIKDDQRYFLQENM